VLAKIKNNIKKARNNPELRDPRTLGLVVIGVVALSVTWSSTKAIMQNRELLDRIATLRESNEVLRLQNDNKKLENKYYESDQYKELAARRLLGVAAPGERLYIVPKAVALSKATNDYKDPLTQEETAENSEANPVQKSKAQQNFSDWMELFFGNGLRN
jgi:cell division protein FtsB